MTDAELVLLARQGRTEAFDELVTRHQAAAYRAALAALRNPHDADDVTQEAFVRAWSRLHQFRGDASFRTWMLTIVWNRALSRRRTRVIWWRRHAALNEADGVAAGTSPGIDGELRRQVAGAIAQLSPKLRDALLLAQSGEYDYGEIAVMLKIPVGTLKWRVSEARRKVRGFLAARGYVDAT